MSEHPQIHTDWAGGDVRIVADTAYMSVEFEVSADAAERLIESLQLSIAGARRYEIARTRQVLATPGESS